MIEQTYEEVALPELLEGAIANNSHPGFIRDYYCLHALLRKYQPKRFCEIGTSSGLGTMIIKNALGADSHVISLELPKHLCHPSLQVPMSADKQDCVGYMCTLPYEQVRGNSMNYDYRQHYPLDGFFIDSEHDFEHPYHEAKEALRSGAKIIIFHDMDSPNVTRAAEEALKELDTENKYEFYRVVSTRVGYYLKK